MGTELRLEHLAVQRDLFAELGRGNEEGERMIVRFGKERDPPRSVERAKPIDDVGSGEASLFEERPGEREAQAKLRELFERVLEAVEGRAIRALGDPLEDREVSVDIEVRATRAKVEESKPSEPPRLVKVEVEDDLQSRTPEARIASR